MVFNLDAGNIILAKTKLDKTSFKSKVNLCFLVDKLRKYGKSKDHKPNPIVGMGLFMDGNGIPIAMNIYPGNASVHIAASVQIIVSLQSKLKS